MTRFLLALAFAAHLNAADWLTANNHVQNDERELSAETVPNLKLLWKVSFGEQLTAPVVLGPIFTHRGIKELAFVAGAADNLYAVDADLGRLVWKRHFETAPACGATLTAAPVLAPYYGPAPEGDDASTPRRSLFVLSSDGQLHTVRPADSHDLALPIPFLPAGSKAQDLDLKGSVVSTYVENGCAHPKVGQWSIQLNVPGAKPSVQEAAQKPPMPVVAANGLMFRTSGTALTVSDLKTGKQLYASSAIGSEPVVNQLAIANGHIYVVVGQTVYCYGFPMEI